MVACQVQSKIAICKIAIRAHGRVTRWHVHPTPLNWGLEGGVEIGAPGAEKTPVPGMTPGVHLIYQFFAGYWFLGFF